MKAARILFYLTIGMLALSVHAQDDSGQKPPESPPESTKPAEQSSPSSDVPALRLPVGDRGDLPPAGRPGGSRKAMEDKRLAALSRLRDMMFEEIKFSPEKRATLNSMFDNYMAGLITNKEHPHLQPRPEDRSTPQQLPELTKQLAEAEKSGADAETIAQITNKIYAAKIVLEANIVDEPTFFIDYLNSELGEEEKSRFEPLLERWRMLRVPEIAPDDNFKQLRRATRDPLLRESEDLARKLDELIIESIRTVPLGPQRRDSEVMNGLAERTMPKVLELLSPPQREQFEKSLKLVKQWSDTDVEVATKERERLKNYKPVEIRHDTKEAVRAPTQP